MIKLLEIGGPITWLQVVLLFFAIILIFERLLFFQTTRLKEADLLTGLSNHLRKRAFAEATHEASLASGPMGRVLHTIVTRNQLERGELRGVAEDAVGLEIPRIENNLRGILTLVFLAPLSGMLGTVLGMMEVFIQVNDSGGYVTQAKMAQGLFESLTTTAIGLSMALGIYICYIYLHGRAQQIVNRLDAAAVNLVNIIIDARNYTEVVSIKEVKEAAAPVESKIKPFKPSAKVDYEA